MTKAQALQWAKALKSRKYRQCRTMIQDNRGYCCLGVCGLVLTGEVIYPSRKGLLSNYEERLFVDMNDKEKASFKIIAEYIEKSVEQLNGLWEKVSFKKD